MVNGITNTPPTSKRELKKWLRQLVHDIGMHRIGGPFIKYVKAPGNKGLTAVVTGAGGGIGKAVAKELSAMGVHCYLLDRSSDLVDAAVNEITDAGGNAIGAVCDVTDESAIQKLAESITKCDILVNAAGLVRPGALADLQTAEWDALLKVNLTGYFLMARAFTPHLVSSGNGSGYLHTMSSYIPIN